MTSVFAAVDLFTTYRAELSFQNRIIGGIPKDPKVIEAWLRTKITVNNDEEYIQMAKRTMEELGYTGLTGENFEDMEKVSAEMAAVKHCVGFKRDDHGLYIEARQVKAMLKECTNILFAGTKMGITKKGAKSFLAERVFVEPDKIYLGVTEPTGIDTVIGHVSGPRGPQSTLAYVEYVDKPVITFDVMAAKDCIPDDMWGQVWVLGEKNGLGAMRSQNHGHFEVTKWSKVG